MWLQPVLTGCHQTRVFQKNHHVLIHQFSSLPSAHFEWAMAQRRRQCFWIMFTGFLFAWYSFNLYLWVAWKTVLRQWFPEVSMSPFSCHYRIICICFQCHLRSWKSRTFCLDSCHTDFSSASTFFFSFKYFGDIVHYRWLDIHFFPQIGGPLSIWKTLPLDALLYQIMSWTCCLTICCMMFLFKLLISPDFCFP